MTRASGLLALLLLAGCSPDVVETAGPARFREPWIEHPSPPGRTPAVAGVLDLDDRTGNGMGPLAADELATLAGLSGRFRVLGRAELRELLAKQGIDPAGTLQGLSRPQGIPGLDCLLCGEVFDLSATNVEYDRRKLQRADLDVRVRIFSARSGALLYEGGLSGAAMVAPGSEGIRLLSGGNGDPVEVRVTKANQVEMIRSAIRKLFLLELPRIDEALSPK